VTTALDHAVQFVLTPVDRDDGKVPDDQIVPGTRPIHSLRDDEPAS
jgi:hypothetical protein